MAKRATATVEVDATESEMRKAVERYWTPLEPNKKGVVMWELNEDCGFEHRVTLPDTHTERWDPESKRVVKGPSVQQVLNNPGIRRTLEQAFALERLRPADWKPQAESED